jgi:hypothetical protein
MPTPSWRLVVDASILRAAGSIGATHPTSTRSRQLLLDILVICHRAILSNELKEEWDSHQSRFSQIWRTQMYSRRKIESPQGRDCTSLRKAVESFEGIDHGQRDAVQKDFLLIEGALNGDQIILSIDNRARTIYSLMSKSIRDLGDIYWLNPVSDDLDVSGVLKGSAQLRAAWKLDPTRGS